MKVPVDQIYVDLTQNSRGEISREDLLDLVMSIKRIGLLNPITVRKSDPAITDKAYTLVAGYTRYRACVEELNWKEIETTLSDHDAFVVMTEENLKRANLSPLQEAKWLQRWHRETGMSFREIAIRIDRSLSWVQGRLKILELDTEHQRMIDAKQITMKDVNELWQKQQSRTEKKLAEIRAEDRERYRETKKRRPTRRVRSNNEIRHLIRQMVEKGDYGTIGITLLNWSIGQVNDAAVIEALGYEVNFDADEELEA